MHLDVYVASAPQIFLRKCGKGIETPHSKFWSFQLDCFAPLAMTVVGLPTKNEHLTERWATASSRPVPTPQPFHDFSVFMMYDFSITGFAGRHTCNKQKDLTEKPRISDGF
jgi:hypothetical protein